MVNPKSVQPAGNCFIKKWLKTVSLTKCKTEIQIIGYMNRDMGNLKYVIQYIWGFNKLYGKIVPYTL